MIDLLEAGHNFLCYGAPGGFCLSGSEPDRVIPGYMILFADPKNVLTGCQSFVHIQRVCAGPAGYGGLCDGSGIRCGSVQCNGSIEDW